VAVAVAACDLEVWFHQAALRKWRELVLLAKYDDAVSEARRQLDGLELSWALQQSELLRFRRAYS